MLDAIGTTDERYFALVAKEQKLHERVLAHPFFSKIPKNYQKKVEERNPPESFVSAREQCKSNRVNHAYYTAVTMHMSHFVHTHPFSVHQLFGFKGGASDALHQMSLPLQYAMAFLSRAIEEWSSLFPEATPHPSSEVERKMKLWNALIERGTKGAA
jgi:hypothetical protein